MSSELQTAAVRSITIAIPTFNRAESLAETLRSLRHVRLPRGVRIGMVVVDNASTDHTHDVVSAAAVNAPYSLRYVREHRQGLSFARNRAVRETQDEHVVFFDDDVEVSPDWLTGYVEAVSAHRADCVVGPVFPRFGEPLPQYATRYVLSLVGSDYSRKGVASQVLPSTVAHQVPGCNFGFRRVAAIELDGFDESLGRSGGALLSGEDTDFGVMLSKRGKTVVYEPRCWINHLIQASKLQKVNLRRRAEGLGASRARLRLKHGPAYRGRDWLRMARRAAGTWARWRFRDLAGNDVDAFEWELRLRRYLAEISMALRGRLTTSIAKPD